MMNDRPALAHLGIFVSDVDAMERFYTEVFGLVVTDRGVGKVFRNTLVFLSGAADQHHQLVLSSGKAPETPSTVMQLSFKVQTLDALRRRKRMAEDRGVSDVMPLNHGNAWSVYFSDPEGNRIEIYVDTPFHTPQPCGRSNAHQMAARARNTPHAIRVALPDDLVAHTARARTPTMIGKTHGQAPRMTPAAIPRPFPPANRYQTL